MMNEEGLGRMSTFELYYDRRGKGNFVNLGGCWTWTIFANLDFSPDTAPGTQQIFKIIIE